MAKPVKQPTSYLAKVHMRLLKKRKAIFTELTRQKEITSGLQKQLDSVDADITAIEKAVQ